ncbi:MAG: 7-carboxy-7-deazaguanine synthase QueE [Candidatus Omnitrophica bacterium]|nr:7-carboxy-7-deazaguanine synthase QueE [Candidatus Omnitrophota bacterium]MBU1869135.1 7-carboxy-7-deazaguanine synthase QueE [Candidatus Omnitrophota bacterium]
MKGKISEVFESIQGEGLYLGERQVFVRFFGCNLKCRYCDTTLTQFSEYAPEELFKQINFCNNGLHSVSFTGGEPLLQKDFLNEMLKLTSASGYKNYLETNGSLPDELEDVIERIDFVAMDLKLPSSSGNEELWDSHARFLDIASRKEVFLKAVICAETKEDDLLKAIDLVKRINRSAVLVLQPNSAEDKNLLSEKIAGFKDICGKEGVIACAIPQMHKIVGLR